MKSRPGCEPGDDACGVLVFSSGCSTSASEKQAQLGYGQEVFVPTKWINTEHIKVGPWEKQPGRNILARC